MIDVVRLLGFRLWSDTCQALRRADRYHPLGKVWHLPGRRKLAWVVTMAVVCVSFFARSSNLQGESLCVLNGEIAKVDTICIQYAYNLSTVLLSAECFNVARPFSGTT